MSRSSEPAPGVDVDLEMLVVGVLLAAAGTRWVEQTIDDVEDSLDPFGGLLG